MPESLLKHIQSATVPAEHVRKMTHGIYETVLSVSPYLKCGNFERIHPSDLQTLFAEYDRAFFDSRCEPVLAGRPLRFRMSGRMTSAGGKTVAFTPSDRTRAASYEIVVSSTLLFQTFRDKAHRPISVAGVRCRDRLEALQRVFEHELVHLVEMLLWTRSSCRGRRFQGIASRFFAHTEHTHRLITPRERALVEFGIRPGSRVRFRLDGQAHEGVVNRITKRATVLVPDRRGTRYTDGIRYLTYYVPLSMLEQLDR